MPPPLRLQAVAFISPQNHPVLIRSFSKNKSDELKYHYIAHTSLDVFEERTAASGAKGESYLGLLYSMDDVAVYGYITPAKLKIVLAFALSDAVVRDANVIAIAKAMHMAYYAAVSNPFIKLRTSADDQTTLTLAGSGQWTGFRRRVDEIAATVSTVPPAVS